MIEAENLRIGDIVRYEKNIITVQAIGTNYEEGFIKDKYNVGYNCNELDPIPLTPEILRKNDFKEEVEGTYFTIPIKARAGSSLARYLAVERKKYAWAIFIKYYNVTGYALLCHVKYAHELQHILWVLGKDANLKV